MLTKARSNLTAYRDWAPYGALWTEWAKPVLFAGYQLSPVLDNAPSDFWDLDLEERRRIMNPATAPTPKKAADDTVPQIGWIDSANPATAIILDLPGNKGVLAGVALARMGCRPVPLYNGVNISRPGGSEYTGTVVVKTQEIVDALMKYAGEIPTLPIKDNAPPVFMLDTNRIGYGESRSSMLPGTFDNRWRVFKQDMPSAAFLQRHGIRNVLLHTEGPVIEYDLDEILFQYQKHGLTIRHYNGKDPVKDITVDSPSLLGKVISRVSVMAGLSRNAAGGFGGVIPEDIDWSSGGG